MLNGSENISCELYDTDKLDIENVLIGEDDAEQDFLKYLLRLYADKMLNEIKELNKEFNSY